MEKDKDPNPTVNLGVTSLSKKSIIFGPQNRKFLIAFIILFVIIGIFIIYRSFAFTAVTMTGAEGEFTSVAPTRILDTRNGTGPIQPLAANTEQSIDVTAYSVLRSRNVSSVVINLSVFKSPAAGFITVWSGDDSKPASANIYFKAGQSINTQITTKVGADGKIKLISNVANLNTAIDVFGFYATKDGPRGARFNFTTPTRILDTRNGTGGVSTALASNQTVNVQVVGMGGVPSGATSATLSLTAVTPPADGYLTVYPAGVGKPLVESLNYSSGINISNQITVPIGPDGKIAVYNFGGNTNVVLDLIGYYKPPEVNKATTQQGRYYPVAPERVYDTRSKSNKPLSGGTSRDIAVVSTKPRPGYISGLSTNAVIINPSATSYYRAWQASTSQPNATNINFMANTAQAGLVSVATDASKPTVSINSIISSGQANLTLDLYGYFAADNPATTPSTTYGPTGSVTTDVSACIYTAPTLADKWGGMTYVNYNFDNSDIKEMNHEVTIIKNADGGSSNYFIQLYDADIGSSGQYYGIQTTGLAIWSRWNTADPSNVRANTGAEVITSKELGADFISLRRNFGPLKNGTYKTRIVRAEYDGIGDWFSYYVTLPDGLEQKIGDMRFPRKTTDVPAAFNDGGGQWNEFWPNNGSTLLPVPLLQLEVKAFANGAVKAVHATGRYEKMPNSDMYAISNGGAIRHNIGDTTPRCHFPDASGSLKLW